MTTETVVITAAEGSLSGLTDALRAMSVKVEERPLLSFAPPADWSALDNALQRVAGYGAIALTSPRAARALVSRAVASEILEHSVPLGPSVWAAGPATSAALGEAFGPVRMPLESETARWGAADALARALIDSRVRSPVLFLCGDVHRDELTARLRGSGIKVDEIVCYRSVLGSLDDARRAAARGSLLVVTSPRVSALLAKACPSNGRPDLLAVGPTTAAAAREAGWPPAGVAAFPSVGAVVSAVHEVLSRHSHHD